MRKALKKITAGLLHIDVLGYIPDERGKKRRGGGAPPPPPLCRPEVLQCEMLVEGMRA